MTKCPYCDFETKNALEEIAHMNTAHPDVIEKRLRESGIIVDDYRQGPDLPSFLSLRELQLLYTFILRYVIDEGGMINEETRIGIQVRDRGMASKVPAPWIEFSVGLKQFAIWRNNGDLYAVNPDGSVGDEPLHKND